MITTVAGNRPPPPRPPGVSFFCGDGGPATSACLYYPSAITVDPAGNLFIADTYNDRIRRVDAVTGLISTVAGNGTTGFCGDGGDATAACLDGPRGVHVAPDGSLLIADNQNGRIRRVVCAPDTDGDGLCDAFDLSDGAGLLLELAAVRRRTSAHGEPELRGRFRARLGDAGAEVVASTITSGIRTNLYAGAPPSLRDLPLLSLSLSQDACRFRPASGAQPRSGRCTGPDGEIRIRVAGRNVRVRGAIRGRDKEVPAGPLHAVIHIGELDYQDDVSACTRRGSGSKLRCVRTATKRKR
ncbi:MAG TPA: hypothetical protein VKA21_04960 [Candidatus Binatia bacterium]|nr:hypothetical protein [Candidatus Binatia bacterium]